MRQPRTDALVRPVVATPVVFYSAAVLRWRVALPRTGMDVPVAIAIAIYAASVARGGGEVNFDSVSMFVFLLLGGRYLEMRARHQTGTSPTRWRD
jgi:Cu2+-exporting ATPase